MSNKSLYVGNLPYSTKAEDLEQLFEPYGPVTNARVVENRGFGFVDIPEENLEDAIGATSGVEFQGRALTVNEAKPKTDRGPVGGRGGYSGNKGGSGGGGRGGQGGYGGGGQGGRRSW